MKISVLDWSTVSNKDLSPEIFNALGDVFCYNLTSEKDTVKNIGDAEIVLCNKVKITKDVFKSCPKLKYIGLFATGYNNIDVKSADKNGVTVCNAGSYSSDAVAQHTFAFILEYCSRISEYNRMVQDGEWIKSKTFSMFPLPTSEVAGKTIGIIGFGNIGKAVAKIAEAFNMRVLISTRTKPENCRYELVTQDELFINSDFISIHCPLTAETEELINSQKLSLMKKSAVLINTSRGGVIDEAALAEALDDGRIAAAAIDVLSEEPMSKDSPLRKVKNCIITPHIAWAPFETRKRLLNIVCSNVKAFIEGKPINIINNPK